MSGDDPLTLDHVAVAVWDVDEALSWFVGKLGLRVIHDEHLPAINVRLVYLIPFNSSQGSTTVQLVTPTGPSAVRDFLADEGPGLHHVCFGVRDVEQTVVRVGSESEPPETFLGGKNRTACFLKHRPSGVLVEFTEITDQHPSQDCEG